MRDCFNLFKSPVGGHSLPEKFTFPFHYDPHPLALIAAKELQEYLYSQNDWKHNFGLNPSIGGEVIGKMFGVLVVQNEEKELGFLAAFSGKLAESNQLEGFVPPVFDMLVKDSFFLKEEEVLNKINRKIESIESSRSYVDSKRLFLVEEKRGEELLSLDRKKLKEQKEGRKKRRKWALDSMTESDFRKENEKFKSESLLQQFIYKEFKHYLISKLDLLRKNYLVLQDEIDQLKVERKRRSGILQTELFEKYKFININGAFKNIAEIFGKTILKAPPAGAGECAAPKLLQYAFMNKLKPVTLAEFWWGSSPNAEIRSHQNFYSACIGKCQPILTHMLEGMEVDDNPMLKNPAEGKELEIIFEDDAIIIVNKPEGFLSVPGRNISDSVLTRIKQAYPNATGPLLVHRLDMSTSGILLIAKRKEYHQYLQRQFIQRLVSKRYVALLEGEINESEGVIDLPLRGDFLDRPRQMVCYKKGKPASTRWKLIEKKAGRARVYFYPLSGRTHQLRVHSAHKFGLNTPIVGDDLYGKIDDRLYLHAEFIEFRHPKSGKIVSFQIDAAF